MESNNTDENYFIPPTNTLVTDYFIKRANECLSDNRIQEDLNYQQKISALNALAELLDVVEFMGLKVASPPSEVHSVSGSKQKLGDFYCPDMIDDCLRRNNITLKTKDRVLDFGCSSGRVVRVLSSYHQDVEWYGCDPRQSSIDWAKENFPGIHFFANNESPPFNHLADQSLTGAYAISVWSHFSESLALLWFDEMARVIKPGGFLLFTTHGYRSVKHFSDVKKSMPLEKADERLLSLNSEQYHFKSYGKNQPSMSDLTISDWGLSFVPIAWYQKDLSKHWRILEHMPGRLMANQDVYLLLRN